MGSEISTPKSARQWMEQAGDLRVVADVAGAETRRELVRQAEICEEMAARATRAEQRGYPVAEAAPVSTASGGKGRSS